MIPSGSRFFIYAAANAIAIAVLRPSGSYSIFSSGIPRSISVKLLFCPSEAKIIMFSWFISPFTLSTVSSIIVLELIIERNCFGFDCRDNGQNRLPEPPAKITA